MLYPVLQDPLHPIVSSLFDRPRGASIGQMLFGAGEQGGWYDVSDMSTLFQDAAGTTPVTAVEQPVGRILDKSGRGNHATQATTTKRPVLSRLVNLLTESEFRNGVTDAPVRSGVDAALMAGYAGAIWFSGDTVSRYAYKIADVRPNTEYTLSVVVEMDDGLPPVFGGANASSNANSFALLICNAAQDYTRTVVTPMGGNKYRCSYSSTTPASISSYPGIIKYGAQTRGFKVTAYDLRFATDAHLPYQRVNTATDYDADPSKFPAYLRFDGVDDALQTGNIDFTSTDKMTVWAGVTKLSDAATAMLLESSVNINANSGSFYITAPETPGTGGFSFKSRGSVSPTPANLYGNAAPISRVVAAIGDIGGDITTIRAGGASATSAQDQGTGNYGNYPLYIGARAGTSIFFNGRIYSLIVRGAQSSLSQIEATELYIKQKMRMP